MKRTLTDEQIRIFRHSEIESMRRKQAKKHAKKVSEDPNEVEGQDIPSDHDKMGEVKPLSAVTPSQKKKKGPTQSRLKEPKPDLRKRTWDVVDKGLDTLDYD